MAKDTAPKRGAKPATSREERLKAALKANMSRRKAQARARTAEAEGGAAATTVKDPQGQDKDKA